MERYWKRNLYVIWSGLFFNHLAYTLSVPFFPLFLGNDLGIRHGLTFWSGVSISVSFLISALCAPLWASIGDKYGKKPMLLRSGIGLGAAHLANYFVYDPYSFLLVRIFQGLMAGFSPLSVAFVGTHTPEKHIGYALGVVSTATAAGGILGPLAGGFISHEWGLRACFLVSAFITLFSSSMILFGVKEEKVRRGHRSRPGIRAELRSAFRTPGLGRILLLTFAAMTSVTVLEPLLSLYVVQIGGSAENAALSSGIVFSAVGVATVLTGAYWGKLGSRIGYGKVLLIGLMGGALGNVLQTVVPHLAGFGVLRFGYGLFFAAVFPSLNALAVRHAGPDFRSSAVSLGQSASQLGIVAGPLLGGWLGGAVGIPAVFLLTGAGLLACAGFARGLALAPTAASVKRTEAAGSAPGPRTAAAPPGDG